MARRPLVATMITTLVGALVGAGLGALVGRLIALFGDETIQTSVPVVFCGALGYFVGGASAAKGSLERFGATRRALGTTAATVILVALVGGAFVSRAPGGVVAVVGVMAAALAGAAAGLIGRPENVPVGRPAAADLDERRAARAADLVPPPPPLPRPSVRKVPVAAKSDPEPVRAPEDDESANWILEQEAPKITPPPAPRPRPRRDRPLRKGDA